MRPECPFILPRTARPVDQNMRYLYDRRVTFNSPTRPWPHTGIDKKYFSNKKMEVLAMSCLFFYQSQAIQRRYLQNWQMPVFIIPVKLTG